MMEHVKWVSSMNSKTKISLDSISFRAYLLYFISDVSHREIHIQVTGL